jgi:hypothetical protein
MTPLPYAGANRIRFRGCISAALAAPRATRVNLVRQRSSRNLRDRQHTAVRKTEYSQTGTTNRSGGPTARESARFVLQVGPRASRGPSAPLAEKDQEQPCCPSLRGTSIPFSSTTLTS